MQKIDRVEIRLLSQSDIPAAMKLKEAAGWNQTENDWRCLLKLEPNGCFAAVVDEELVGTTTTTSYGDQLAWIGMVLVQPDKRRMGIATKLMMTALDYLKPRVATVKLDATAQGKPVYEKFGFQVESLVERWSGTVIPTTVASQRAGVGLDSDTHRALLEIDLRAFDADRASLVNDLVDRAFVSPALTRKDDGSLSGYALVRKGSNAEYVGPVVSTDHEQVGTLLDGVFSQLNGRRLYIDFNTGCGIDSSLLADRGFVKERDLIRMSMGMPVRPTSALVVGIAGPEVG